MNVSLFIRRCLYRRKWRAFVEETNARRLTLDDLKSVKQMLPRNIAKPLPLHLYGIHTRFSNPYDLDSLLLYTEQYVREGQSIPRNLPIRDAVYSQSLLSWLDGRNFLDYFYTTIERLEQIFNHPTTLLAETLLRKVYVALETVMAMAEIIGDFLYG